MLPATLLPQPGRPLLPGRQQNRPVPDSHTAFPASVGQFHNALLSASTNRVFLLPLLDGYRKYQKHTAARTAPFHLYKSGQSPWRLSLPTAPFSDSTAPVPRRPQLPVSVQKSGAGPQIRIYRPGRPCPDTSSTVLHCWPPAVPSALPAWKQA